MTLTIVDGVFPREVISRENLHFDDYSMGQKKNNPRKLDATLNGPNERRGFIGGPFFRIGGGSGMGSSGWQVLGVLFAGLLLLVWIGLRWQRALFTPRLEAA